MLNNKINNTHNYLQEKVTMMNFIKKNISTCNFIDKENFFYNSVPKRTLRAMCELYNINYSNNKHVTIQRIVMYESDPDNIDKVFICRKQML